MMVSRKRLLIWIIGNVERVRLPYARPCTIDFDLLSPKAEGNPPPILHHCIRSLIYQLFCLPWDHNMSKMLNLAHQASFSLGHWLRKPLIGLDYDLDLTIRRFYLPIWRHLVAAIYISLITFENHRSIRSLAVQLSLTLSQFLSPHSKYLSPTRVTFNILRSLKAKEVPILLLVKFSRCIDATQRQLLQLNLEWRHSRNRKDELFASLRTLYHSIR